jgi:hypothetical protein
LELRSLETRVRGKAGDRGCEATRRADFDRACSELVEGACPELVEGLSPHPDYRQQSKVMP